MPKPPKRTLLELQRKAGGATESQRVAWFIIAHIILFKSYGSFHTAVVNGVEIAGTCLHL